jgi:raffinose/stachyose/melibiose transport system substrate-binding protein
MKKILKAHTFILLGLLMLLAACSNESGGEASKGKTEDGEIIVNFPHFYVGTDPHAQWFDKVVKEFNKEHEGEIKVVTEEIAGEQNYVDKIKLLLQTEDLPDIVISRQGLLDIAHEAGKTWNLTPYLEADPEFKKQIHPESLKVNTFNGEVHGIPNSRTMIGYFYNKELFKQAGISQPAKTWDELFEQFEKLKAAGIIPVSMDTADTGWLTSLWFNAMIGSSSETGLKFMNTYYPKDFNKAFIVDSLTKIQTMLQEYTTSDAIGASYDTAAMHFLNGQTAMIANGPWMIGAFSDPAKAKEGLAENIGAALYPEQTLFNTPEKGLFVMSQDQEHADAAVEFLKELTSPERQREMLLLKGELPDSPLVEIDSEIKEKYPILADLLEKAKKAENEILDYQQVWYSNVTNEVSNIYPTLATGQLTPEQASQKLTDIAKKND